MKKIASTFNEHQLQLTLQTFERDPQLSIHKTIRFYKILHSTLFHRINGRSIYADIIPNLQKLTVLKEEMIVREVLDLNSRGFPPRMYDIEDMVNRLLKIYDMTHIGLH